MRKWFILASLLGLAGCSTPGLENEREALGFLRDALPGRKSSPWSPEFPPDLPTTAVDRR